MSADPSRTFARVLSRTGLIVVAGLMLAAPSAQTQPAVDPAAAGGALDLQAALPELRAEIARLPLERQPRLNELAAQLQAADETLAARRLQLTPVEVQVAQAQIALGWLRLSAAVREPGDERGGMLATAARAIGDALGSTRRQAEELKRLVRVELAAPVTSGAATRQATPKTAGEAASAASPMRLQVYALPVGLVHSADLLAPTQLERLLTLLRAANPVMPGRPSELILGAGGHYLVWVAEPVADASMAQHLQARREVASRPVPEGAASPLTLHFDWVDRVQPVADAAPTAAPAGTAPRAGARP